MADVAHHAPAAPVADVRGLTTTIESLRARYAKWRLYRRTLNELAILTDRELADLGLPRTGLRGIAWQAVYGN